MADIVDTANDYAQLMIENAIKNRAVTEVKIYKLCRNCKEETNGNPFCDDDCCDDFEKRERLKV